MYTGMQPSGGNPEAFARSFKFVFQISLLKNRSSTSPPSSSARGSAKYVITCARSAKKLICDPARPMGKKRRRTKQHAESAPVAETDYTRRLPSELLISTIGCLDQPAVIAAAAVCSRWRIIARTQRTYYAHVALRRRYLRSTRAYRDDARQFANQLARAQAAGVRLSVSIYLDEDCCRCDDGRFDSPASDSDEEVLCEACKIAIPYTLRALSVVLSSVFKLDIGLPPSCYPARISALSRKAPLLQSLALDFLTSGDIGCDGPPVPSALFQESAPILTEVCLAGVPLRHAVAAFAIATRVELRAYTDSHFSCIKANFPNARFLKLEDLGISFDDYDDDSDGDDEDYTEFGPGLCPTLTNLEFSIDDFSYPILDLLRKRPIRDVQAEISLFDSKTISALFSPTHQLIRAAFRISQDNVFRSRDDDDTPLYHIVAEMRNHSNSLRRAMLFLPGEEKDMFRALQDVVAHVADLCIPAVLLAPLASVLGELPELEIIRVDVDDSAIDYRIRQDSCPPIQCPRLQSVLRPPLLPMRPRG